MPGVAGVTVGVAGEPVVGVSGEAVLPPFPVDGEAGVPPAPAPDPDPDPDATVTANFMPLAQCPVDPQMK